ncbi:hypothetical protein AVEN_180291-1 [Araneus ventricosus]|uniref:Uncharacterized protein n=1 Tax=Araneus ventricosus TaxID=182803 RepID=A0A4Y2HYI4_ARAVE|nr:hypothetical protein AVEN_180291-1 [Araneus ventricosus]
MLKRIQTFRYGPWSFSQLSLQILASSFRYLRMWRKVRSSKLRNFLSSNVIFSFYQTKSRKYSTLVKNLLLNKLSKIKIAKLLFFRTDNEDVLKQQPDATSSSDNDQICLLHQDLRLMDPDALEVQYQGP